MKSVFKSLATLHSLRPVLKFAKTLQILEREESSRWIMHMGGSGKDPFVQTWIATRFFAYFQHPFLVCIQLCIRKRPFSHPPYVFFEHSHSYLQVVIKQTIDMIHHISSANIRGLVDGDPQKLILEENVYLKLFNLSYGSTSSSECFESGILIK